MAVLAVPLSTRSSYPNLRIFQANYGVDNAGRLIIDSEDHRLMTATGHKPLLHTQEGMAELGWVHESDLPRLPLRHAQTGSLAVRDGKVVYDSKLAFDQNFSMLCVDGAVNQPASLVMIDKVKALPNVGPNPDTLHLVTGQVVPTSISAPAQITNAVGFNASGAVASSISTANVTRPFSGKVIEKTFDKDATLESPAPGSFGKPELDKDGNMVLLRGVPYRTEDVRKLAAGSGIQSISVPITSGGTHAFTFNPNGRGTLGISLLENQSGAGETKAPPQKIR